MEDMAKLGNLALKLERYRANIIHALSWVVFGMVFSGFITLANALVLLGYHWSVFWISLAIAGTVGGYIFGNFCKFLPKVKKRWKIGIPLLFIPFIVAYAFVPKFITANSFYFSVIWYPSLGFGLLLYGIYAERDEIRAMPYAGISMILSSLILIPLSNLPMNNNNILASGLICTSLMILIYFATAIYVFFKAHKIYA